VVVVAEALGVVAPRAGVPAGAGPTGRGRDCGGGATVTMSVTMSLTVTVTMSVTMSLTVTVSGKRMSSAVVGRAGAMVVVAMMVVAVVVVRAILGAALDIVGAAVAVIVQCSRACVGAVVVKASGGREDGHWRTNFRRRDAVWLPVQCIGCRTQLVG
jgi:hypothetical protein